MTHNGSWLWDYTRKRLDELLDGSANESGVFRAGGYDPRYNVAHNGILFFDDVRNRDSNFEHYIASISEGFCPQCRIPLDANGLCMEKFPCWWHLCPSPEAKRACEMEPDDPRPVVVQTFYHGFSDRCFHCDKVLHKPEGQAGK